MFENRGCIGVIALAVLLFATTTLFGVEGLGEVPTGAPSEPEAHSRAACHPCHRLVATTGGSDVPPADRGQVCHDCHLPSQFGPPTKLPFHSDESRPCLGCHRFHDTQVLIIGESDYYAPIGSFGLESHCQNCHAYGRRLNDLLPGHLVAGAFYHNNMDLLESLAPSSACLACHSRDSDLRNLVDPADAPRFFDHASHPFGVPYSPRAQGDSFILRHPISSNVELVDGQIECQTCHRLTSGNLDLLAVSQSEGMVCEACHERIEH